MMGRQAAAVSRPLADRDQRGALDANGIQKVSKLPPRQELLAQLVSSLQSPISGLVGTLEGVVREFVYTLQAVADKKSSEA